MSLSLTPVYEAMCRQFNTTAGDGRFKADFVFCCNLVLDQLSNTAKLTTALTHVASPTDDVDDLEEEESYILTAGLIFELVNAGYKHVRGDLAFAAAKSLWEDAQSDYMVIQQREDQEDLEDDDVEPTADIIGLGNLEDE